MSDQRLAPGAGVLSHAALDELAALAWEKLGLATEIVNHMEAARPDEFARASVVALYLAAFITASDRYVL